MAKSAQISSRPSVRKRVLGVRIARSARQALLIRFLNSPAGKLLIAEALAIAAGAVGAGRRKSSGKSPRNPGDHVTLEEARARLSYACLQAMKAFRAALAEKDRAVTYEGTAPVGTVETRAAPRRRKRLPRRTGRTG